MQPPDSGSANGNGSVKDHLQASADVDDLRATCRRQAHLIDTLTGAIVKLRTGTTALEAENAELRAGLGGLNGGRRNGGTVGAREDQIEARFALDVQAPAAARAAVAGALRDRVPTAVLDSAQLVVSELATNSVRHSGASPGGQIVLRVEPSRTTVRLEVEDPGCSEAVVARAPDLQGGSGGFGLNLVHTLSERWGVEHTVVGGTRVWAHLPLAALVAVATTG